MSRRFFACTLLAIALSAGMAKSENFPLASCSGIDGTLIDRSGVDTKSATIRGTFLQPNFMEYCLRDPGGETVEHGGKLSVEQCVTKHMGTTKNTQLLATANCSTGTLTSEQNSKKAAVRFPVSKDADVSCASGYPPLERQFVLLCPQKAEELGIGQY